MLRTHLRVIATACALALMISPATARADNLTIFNNCPFPIFVQLNGDWPFIAETDVWPGIPRTVDVIRLAPNRVLRITNKNTGETQEARVYVEKHYKTLSLSWNGFTWNYTFN
jgi:hypothetical protein